METLRAVVFMIAALPYRSDTPGAVNGRDEFQPLVEDPAINLEPDQKNATPHIGWARSGRKGTEKGAMAGLSATAFDTMQHRNKVQRPLVRVASVNLSTLEEILQQQRPNRFARQASGERTVVAGPAVPGIISGYTSPDNWSLALAIQPMDGLETPKPVAQAAFRRIITIYRLMQAVGAWVAGSPTSATLAEFNPKGLNLLRDSDGLLWPADQFVQNWLRRFHHVVSTAGAMMPWRTPLPDSFYETRGKDIVEMEASGRLRRELADHLATFSRATNWTMAGEGWRVVGELVPQWGQHRHGQFAPTLLSLGDNYDAKQKLFVWKLVRKLDGTPGETMTSVASTEVLVSPAVVDASKFNVVADAATKDLTFEQGRAAMRKLLNALPASVVIRKGIRSTDWTTVDPAQACLPGLIRDLDLSNSLLAFASKAGLEVQGKNLEEMVIEEVDQKSVIPTIRAIIAEQEDCLGVAMDEAAMGADADTVMIEEAPPVGEMADEVMESGAPQARHADDIAPFEDVDMSEEEKALEMQALSEMEAEKRELAFVAGLGDDE